MKVVRVTNPPPVWAGVCADCEEAERNRVPLKCGQCSVNEAPLNEAVAPGYHEPNCRDCEVAMMSSPERWPLGDRLPLKRRESFEVAMVFNTDEGLLFTAFSGARTPTNPDAVYDDGWRVD